MANITINDTPTRIQYVATASQTEFDYNFPIKESLDLKVYKRAGSVQADDTADLLIFGVDYTVTGANTASGGTVILTSGADDGDIITIMGDKPVDRTAIYDQSVTLTKSDLNNDFNDNIMFDKQVTTEVDQLGLKYNRSERITPTYREDNLRLPILNDDEVWVGRGNAGDDPDDVIKLGLSELFPSSTIDFVIGTTYSDRFPNAQYLFNLADGLMINNGGTILTQVLTGTSNQIAVADGSGVGGTPTVSLADNLQMPGAEGFVPPSGTTGQRPGAPIDGQIRYNSDNDDLEGFVGGDWESLTTGSAQTSITINQVGHGFTAGQIIRFDGSDYVLAQADTLANAEVAGMVGAIEDADNFTLLVIGEVDGLSGLTAGDLYYLDPAVAGGLTSTRPTTTDVVVPLLIATSTTGGLFYGKTAVADMAYQDSAGVAITGGLATGLSDLSTGANGLDVNPGSDTDADLVTVGVTGTPKLIWKESEDGFKFNNGLMVGAQSALTYSLDSVSYNASMQLFTDDAATFGGLVMTRHNDTPAYDNKMIALRSRGTASTPTAVQEGDILYSITPAGYDGSNYISSARIDFAVGRPVLPGIVAGEMRFYTRNSAGTMLERVIIDDNGVIAFANNTVLTWEAGSIALSAISGALVLNGGYLVVNNGAAFANTIAATGGIYLQSTDTTLTRASAGDMNIEGNIVYRAGGTDVPITDGGTGASTQLGAITNLVDGAALTSVAVQDNDKVLIQDISDGDNLKVTTALEIAQLASGGDVSGPTTSTDEALARWDGTTGNLLQDSLVTLNDAGQMGGLTRLQVDNLRLNGNTLSTQNANGDLLLTPDGTGEVHINSNVLKIDQSIVLQGNPSTNITFATNEIDLETNGVSRLNVTNSGMQLGAANARVTTILDEDDMASDSDTALATQQSIKAYVDSATGGTGLTWSTVTTNITMAANNGYIANGSSAISLELPATAAVGDVFEVVGKGSGSWDIIQQAGQTIYFGISSTTTGLTGNIQANHFRDCVRIICITANTEFQVVSSIGNFTIQ